MNLLFANDTPGRRSGGYPHSWYAATTPMPAPNPPLRGRVRADVCVVGGGYTGLSAALHLARAGRSVVVLEARRVGFGASGRNGGQVLAGHRVDQMALETMVGRDDARRLFTVSLESVALVRDLSVAGNIACDWQSGAADMAWRAKARDHLHRHADYLAKNYAYPHLVPFNRDGVAEYVNTDVYAGGVFDPMSGHLNPLAFAFGVAGLAENAGAVIYEDSLVQHIGPRRATTAHGWVEADHILLACNGYLGGLSPESAKHVMPINSFVIATEPLPTGAALRRPIAVADDRFVVNYYRSTPDHRLLFGGGESYGYRFPKNIAALVRKPLCQTFPHLSDVRITHAWGGTLAITMTRMPYLGAPHPGVWTASGYSGHGVALATLAGKMIAAAIGGDRAGFDLLARVPTPRFFGGPVLRAPLLATAMTWYALRDRLGI